MESTSHKLNVELVTPSRIVFNDTADMIVVPGSEGDLGILVRHAPMISTLRLGTIRTEGRDQGDDAIFVAGGFVEVTGTACTVIAEEAYLLSDVNVEDVQNRIEEANSLINSDNASEAEILKAKKDKEIAQELIKHL